MVILASKLPQVLDLFILKVSVCFFLLLMLFREKLSPAEGDPKENSNRQKPRATG